MLVSDSRSIPFIKLEGCGNDYLFVDRDQLNESQVTRLTGSIAKLAPRICHRHFGVGADGIVLFERGGTAACRMQMWNADGSRGALCGNALRCLAKLVGEEDMQDRTHFDIQSDVGLHAVTVHRDRSQVVWSEVQIGRPRFAASDIPLLPEHVEVLDTPPGGAIALRLDAMGAKWEGLCLSVGNPHLIVPLDKSPDHLPIDALGSALERHPAFPERINVGFVQLLPGGHARARTFERGSGQTLACGSNVCAMVVALTSLGAHARGSELQVSQPGGTLVARWDDDGNVHLAGPAREVFGGRFELLE